MSDQPTRPRLVDRQAVIDILSDRLADYPSGRQWAIAHGLSEAYLSDVRSGRRIPGRKILQAIGVARVEAYRIIREIK